MPHGTGGPGRWVLGICAPRRLGAPIRSGSLPPPWPCHAMTCIELEIGATDRGRPRSVALPGICPRGPQPFARGARYRGGGPGEGPGDSGAFSCGRRDVEPRGTSSRGRPAGGSPPSRDRALVLAVLVAMRAMAVDVRGVLRLRAIGAPVRVFSCRCPAASGRVAARTGEVITWGAIAASPLASGCPGRAAAGTGGRRTCITGRAPTARCAAALGSGGDGYLAGIFPRSEIDHMQRVLSSRG